MSNFVYRDESCYRDRVNRAAGRRAVVMVFASPFRQFYNDGTNPAHLSGLSHLDNSIMTRKLSSIYLDFAKTHANPDTDGNFPYHRAVIKNTHCNLCTIRLPVLQVIKCIMTRQLRTVYKFLPRHTIALPNISANPQIKNWHSRIVCLIISVLSETNYSTLYKLYRET